ncbi:MAG TPA: 2-amino-4-hydroxy-6-hydroxymethyldihydropteridine diphosphokinase, partial [Gillisia sp.]|nr:2-amino-4-hydroxy-6-hydroxymethyldihydropteridine diphosphokinase [Gillisia sp.]
MKLPKTFYIALGSNEGNRFDLLQAAVDQIFLQIGDILKISPVYETPAWGFKGNAFLNACVVVNTRYPAEKVLQLLLGIEVILGRRRNDSATYQNRSIDLDILLVEGEIIESASLQVPHPQLQNRKFVLLPLADVASGVQHPVFKKSIGEILKSSGDVAEISVFRGVLNQPGKKYAFRQSNYIAIEGNIGAGKTSLSTMISQDFNAKLILERFKDNPFLPKFYEDSNRYAFPLEMSFLADRYQQLSDDLAQYDLFTDFVVSDYDVFKSLIFARITLPEEEFVLLPLADVASGVQHPVFKKSIGEILKSSGDVAEISVYRGVLNQPGKKYAFRQRNYIAIEGNIGAGKTSLSTMISQDFNAKLILERFKDNPFLPKFYEDSN